MPTCFIVMPISVPHAGSQYSEATHFRNVLEHLFIPAVKSAGYEAIPPVATGGEIIIAEIIHHLAKADMVLCDISAYNPNVFYELGIRTALDKPVALVRDSHTSRIPFDTAAINIEEYPADLRPWNIEPARDKIKSHIAQSAKKAGGRNAAWRYFGVTDVGEFAPGKATPQDKLDVILNRLDRLEVAKQPLLEKKAPKLRRYFETIRDYLLHGEAEWLIGQWITLGGKPATILSVDLTEMKMKVQVGGEEHSCKLDHADILKLEVSPF